MPREGVVHCGRVPARVLGVGLRHGRVVSHDRSLASSPAMMVGR